MKIMFTAEITVSAYTEVDAPNILDAQKIAKERDVELWRAGITPEEAWIIEEADGTPQNITFNRDVE